MTQHSSPERLGFGPNEWLVDELYQQFLTDRNSVDRAWWDFFADYQPTDTGTGRGPADDGANGATDGAPDGGNGSADGGVTTITSTATTVSSPGAGNGSTTPSAPPAPSAPSGEAPVRSVPAPTPSTEAAPPPPMSPQPVATTSAPAPASPVAEPPAAPVRQDPIPREASNAPAPRPER